jgi:broad specificity phosphatase PhoE
MLYLARHGAVDAKYHGCYNGWLDVGLSPEGEKEAAALAGRLAEVSFDAYYASDLSRCQKSLSPFAPERVISDAGLREKSWGENEGLGYDAICKKRGIVYENFSQWVIALGGESMETFRSRVLASMERIAASQRGTVLVMTHAGVIRTVVAEALGLDLEEAFGMKVPTGSFSRMEKKPDGWIVHEVGAR